MAMRVLVTGASGFIGSKCATHLLERGHEVIGTSSRGGAYVPMDLTHRDTVIRTVERLCPDVILHAASYSNADQCEANADTAQRVNVLGTENIALGAAAVGAHLLFTSSVYVFDGESGFYSASDTPNPINTLGRTKLAAERALQRLLPGFGIVRFGITYGYNGPGCRNGFLDRILEGGILEVNNDQLRQPILIEDLAILLCELAERRSTGFYHAAGSEVMTKHQLAKGLASLVPDNCEIVAVPAARQFAPRPRIGTLEPTRGVTGFRSLEEGLVLLRTQLARDEAFRR